MKQIGNRHYFAAGMKFARVILVAFIMIRGHDMEQGKPMLSRDADHGGGFNGDGRFHGEKWECWGGLSMKGLKQRWTAVDLVDAGGRSGFLHSVHFVYYVH